MSGEDRGFGEAPIGGLEVVFHPLTADRWGDFETLFGPRGACGGCWCMWWRLTHREFEARKGEKNRRAMRERVESDEVPGLIAYAGEAPVGWCAVAPRETYPRLGRSRILKPVDHEPVWSIVCLFVAKAFRRRGVSRALIEAATAHAREEGARIVEGYPVEPTKDEMPDVFAFHGLASAFREAGFEEVARRSETRPIMRWTLPESERPRLKLLD